MDSGAWDAAGNAVLPCEKQGSLIKGDSYHYRVSAVVVVTDVSNQEISTSEEIIANFYLSLSKPEMQLAFAKKGEKLTFTYKMASLDLNFVQNEKTVALLSGSGKKTKSNSTAKNGIWFISRESTIITADKKKSKSQKEKKE